MRNKLVIALTGISIIMLSGCSLFDGSKLTGDITRVKENTVQKVTETKENIEETTEKVITTVKETKENIERTVEDVKETAEAIGEAVESVKEAKEAVDNAFGKVKDIGSEDQEDSDTSSNEKL